MEDKRGHTVDQAMAQTSWLYAGGHPVICSRHMEVAAIVIAMNPVIANGVVCADLVTTQKVRIFDQKCFYLHMRST